jgi:hypothetical protein
LIRAETADSAKQLGEVCGAANAEIAAILIQPGLGPISPLIPKHKQERAVDIELALAAQFRH